MDELYENIITLNKNISVDTFSITKPKTSSNDLSSIISFIDSLSKNLDTLVMHIKTENDILLLKSISDKLDDFISKSQTYSRNELQQVIQPNLHEHCYLFIMNCAQNLKFYEKMTLKKHSIRKQKILQIRKEQTEKLLNSYKRNPLSGQK